MSGIGPTLPPHLLAKRKRQEEAEARDEATTSSGAKQAASPVSDGEKRRRVAGPAMPPAPLDEKPLQPPSPTQAPDSDSDDDDGFGPSLPSQVGAGNGHHAVDEARDEELRQKPSEAKPKRDDWMMMPPQQDDLAARMDPTRQRPRGFNTGKSARGSANGGAGDSSAWHETPEQRQKRLADEIMGVPQPSSIGPQRPSKGASTASADDTAAKIREQVERSRGPSLMEQHQKVKGKEAEDDDPSGRVFDREKDMATGMRIGQVQRQEMLRKASDFSSKFSGGSYL